MRVDVHKSRNHICAAEIFGLFLLPPFRQDLTNSVAGNSQVSRDKALFPQKDVCSSKQHIFFPYSVTPSFQTAMPR